MNPNSPKDANLPLLFPYPLVAQTLRNRDGFVYSFITDSGITYRLLFSSDKDYLTDYPFADSVFSFFISSVNGVVGKADPRIKETVAYAFRVVFSAYPNTIITYICSTENRQERHRRILFGQWFQQYGDGFTRLTHTDNNQVYSAAIFKATHPHKELIEQSFEIIYADK